MISICIGSQRNLPAFIFHLWWWHHLQPSLIFPFKTLKTLTPSLSRRLVVRESEDDDGDEVIQGRERIHVAESCAARNLWYTSRRPEAERSGGLPLLRSFARRSQRLPHHLLFRTRNNLSHLNFISSRIWIFVSY